MAPKPLPGAVQFYLYRAGGNPGDTGDLFQRLLSEIKQGKNTRVIRQKSLNCLANIVFADLSFKQGGGSFGPRLMCGDVYRPLFIVQGNKFHPFFLRWVIAVVYTIV